MRSGIILLVFAAACASTSAGAPESVRERLESSETQLIIARAESAGSITAQRRSSGGWVAGSVALTVNDGELVASASARGAIRIERLWVDVGPIAIPRSVLGYEAQLTDVHLVAEKPVGVVTRWTGADQARATAEMELELSWSLTIDGQTSPLGAPKLPAVPVEVIFTGDGEAVHAEVRVASSGTFWSWADLVKLEDLGLVLSADTVTP
jgi:hypothetical protein